MLAELEACTAGKAESPGHRRPYGVQAKWVSRLETPWHEAGCSGADGRERMRSDRCMAVMVLGLSVRDEKLKETPKLHDILGSSHLVSTLSPLLRVETYFRAVPVTQGSGKISGAVAQTPAPSASPPVPLPTLSFHKELT